LLTLEQDLSRIPSFADLEDGFDSPDDSRLFHLKNAAKLVYSHWKERRIKRGGKLIMPQLDYDETREDNPYVCFRRRDPKNVRKTRRTDAQNVDRLVRLSTDLAAARELMLKVLERERTKRDPLITELYVFEGRVQVRELKRKLGEKDGDESLLIGKREKRRKPNLEDLPVQQYVQP
jgi:enhancer of polycomb-like protein